MTGELDYRDIFLSSGTFHVLQKILLVFIILIISITVMNLLTVLAVGDINNIMARSKEEKRRSLKFGHCMHVWVCSRTKSSNFLFHLLSGYNAPVPIGNYQIIENPLRHQKTHSQLSEKWLQGEFLKCIENQSKLPNKLVSALCTYNQTLRSPDQKL